MNPSPRTQPFYIFFVFLFFFKLHTFSLSSRKLDYCEVIYNLSSLFSIFSTFFHLIQKERERTKHKPLPLLLLPRFTFSAT